MVPSTLNFARGSSSKKSESAMLTETFGTCFKNTCDHTSAAAYKTETKTFQHFICSKVRTLQMYSVKFETQWKNVHWAVLPYCTRLLDCEFQHIPHCSFSLCLKFYCMYLQCKVLRMFAFFKHAWQPRCVLWSLSITIGSQNFWKTYLSTFISNNCTQILSDSLSESRPLSNLD